ncbi:class I SAM-dependent methyltransferase [Micromonospora sp. NPDC050686]|uniref:class I SAM-dependent methyltransferase n=1 Tax=Micromonospora sp. NPDC050686 TaxID=3154631 RepID=UPI0033CBA15F
MTAAATTATPTTAALTWPGDWATDELWRLIWYGPAHQGWEFGSYAGPALIERAIDELPLRAQDRVLHLGGDAGETCRYLALRLGCPVRAMEPDPVRLGHARRRIRALPAGTAAPIRIAGSSPEGTPGPPYDRVLALQPARAGDDPATVLRLAGLALPPGGRLMLSEVVRRRPARPLGTAPAGLEARLRRAGFGGIRSVDISDEAAYALRSAQLALIRRHREVVRHIRPSGADQLLALIRAAQDDLRNGRSGFWAISATRSSAEPGRA